MFISILILILFIPAAFLPLALDTFSPNELSEMGVCLEDVETANSMPIINPCNRDTVCQVWNIAEQVAA